MNAEQILAETPLQFMQRTGKNPYKGYHQIVFSVDSASKETFAEECPPGTEFVLNYRMRATPADEAIGTAYIPKNKLDAKAIKKWKSTGLEDKIE